MSMRVLRLRLRFGTRPLATALARLAFAALAGCSRSPDEVVKPTPATTAAADAGRALPTIPPHPKPVPPPDDPDAAKPLLGARDPDWDLDTVDPARDYVRRYVRSVQRYGSSMACIDPQPSASANGSTSVRVTDASPATCPQPSGVDETFTVDVGADRLSLPTPQTGRVSLHKWPDDSDPASPPTTPVHELAVAQWKTAAARAVRDHGLAMLRIQLYGRGSYPVVTLAGWPRTLNRTSSADTLNAFARDMCAASGGLPLGFFAAVDRVNILRVRCYGATPTAIWDVLK